MAALLNENTEVETQGAPNAARAGGDMSKGCKRYAVDLSAYFDGELEGDALTDLERHLDRCEGCRDTLQRLRKLRNALHALARPPRRQHSILDDLKARMEEADEDPPDSDDPLPC